MPHYTENWKEISKRIISQLIDEEKIRFNRNRYHLPDEFKGYPIINGIYPVKDGKNRLGGKLIGYTCNNESGTGHELDPVVYDFKYFMEPEFVVEMTLLSS